MMKLFGQALSVLATAVAAFSAQVAFAAGPLMPEVVPGDIAGVYSSHDPKYQLFTPAGIRHAGGVMNWRYNDANRPGSVTKANAIAQTQAAMAKWTAVCSVTFVYQGETAVGFNTGDGNNVVGWDTSIVAPTTGITYVAWNGSNTITDAEIRLNPNFVAGFDATLVHEVGHALGLQHSNVNGAVMSGPPDSNYNGMASLAADDIAGCVFLYGGGGGPGPGPDVTAPSVPGSLVATATGQTSIGLSWNASTDNVAVTSYNVFNGGSLLGTVTGTSASVTGLAPGTAYTFRVQACDSAGNCSAQSSPASATTQAPVVDTQAPTVPANLSAAAAGQSSVNLSWSASTDNIGVANYRVFNGGTQVGTVTGTSTSVNGLSPSTAYTFRVSACDVAGNCSAQSSPASATTSAAVVDTQAPSVPANLFASAGSASSINLSWSPSSDNVGVTSYRVFRSGTQVATVTSAGATVSGLAASTTYSFTVSACDGAGNCSAQSTQASATTLASGGGGGGAPAMPVNLVATTVNSTTINLTWLGSSETATFRVYRDGVLATTVTTLGATINGLQPSTTYSFTVQACSSGGNCSVQSPAVTGRTAGPGSGSPTTYQDLWWSPGENGWGLTITQHGEALFIAFYIYDSTGKPTWVVMSSGTWDAAHTTYSGNVYIPTGSWFGNYDKSRFVVGPSAGSASIRFTSTSAGTLTYSVNGATGTKTIARLPFGPVDTTPITDYTDAWWAGSQENGWGLVLTQQYHKIFAAWYTYDPSGQTTWYVLSDGNWTSANTYTGKLYRTRGSQVLGGTYNQGALSVVEVGTLTLTFTSASTGTMTYVVDGLTQVKAISRLEF